MLAVMGEMDGHVNTHLYRDVFHDRSYLIVSEWENREAFDVFVASEQFQNVIDWGNANILASRPKHEIYEGAAAPFSEAGCPYHESRAASA